MLVDDEEVLEKIFRSTNLPISVHCEDEDIIKSNIKQFKLKYGNEIPIKFHPLIRSRESCIKSTKKAIRIAKKQVQNFMFSIYLLKKKPIFFQMNFPKR